MLLCWSCTSSSAQLRVGCGCMPGNFQGGKCNFRGCGTEPCLLHVTANRHRLAAPGTPGSATSATRQALACSWREAKPTAGSPCQNGQKPQNQRPKKNPTAVQASSAYPKLGRLSRLVARQSGQASLLLPPSTTALACREGNLFPRRAKMPRITPGYPAQFVAIGTTAMGFLHCRAWHGGCFTPTCA